MTDDRKPKSSIDEETKQILIDCLKDTPGGYYILMDMLGNQAEATTEQGEEE
jgi:hypothetical protein